MNSELEKQLKRNSTLMGYKNLVEAIMRCDDEVIDQVTDKYNKVISDRS